VDQALGQALHVTPPEPKISEEMKRLWKDSVANWEMQQLPKAREEADAAEQALQDFARAQLGRGPYSNEQWEQRDALVTRRDAAVDRVNALLSDKDEVGLGAEEGDVARYYRLLKEHQAEYGEWLVIKRNITPTSPEALQILADVEAVGAVARAGIRTGIARAEAEQVYPQTGVEYESTREGVRRHLARRVVAELRGHADNTTQKWLTDFDMTKSGALRGLREDEKQMLTESLLFFPKDWVSGFDRLGQVTTDKSTRGYFGTDGTRKKTHHISLSTPHNLEDRGALQTTAVHEVGHGMERVIPGLNWRPSSGSNAPGRVTESYWRRSTGPRCQSSPCIPPPGSTPSSGTARPSRAGPRTRTTKRCTGAPTSA
jgi:hypothetical protein